jgi:hypothetical protein
MATTLYAARGRLIPFNSNSPTGSTLTVFSTFVSTRALIKICPDYHAATAFVALLRFGFGALRRRPLSCSPPALERRFIAFPVG